MSDISNLFSNAATAYNQPYAKNAKEPEKTDVKEAAAKSNIPGRTIGDVKLSEKAQKYYEDLRNKFHNMEFVLVSEDQKENAKAHAASFANKNKMVVLIDEAKIERMANDANYRAQYEGIIERAASGFNQFAESVAKTGANVKGYGVQVNDNGTMSYFAVLEKSSEAQAKRIAEKRAKNQAEKKAEAKKDAKERAEERIEDAREARRTEGKDRTNKSDSEDTVITANSLEELLLKIQDHVQNEMTNNVVTEAEKAVGQNIDFSA